jgi:ATP-dependent DNA helicase RecQ
MTDTAAADRIAESVLGFSLRPSQRRALGAIGAGRDTLAVLPTGSGKSAIYQVGGLLLGGLTVVVSPLIALQRDQLRSLIARGSLRAVMLNSTQHHAERVAALDALRTGDVDFVMLGPEQLANAETLGEIVGSPRPVTLVAVDEAHLVSEWGHDFRPEYLRLADVIRAVGRPPVLALTATAAPPVQADITRQLHMTDPEVIVADFDRPNIHLAVRRTRHGLPEAQAIDDRTVEVVLAHDGPTLVYALTHARCESLAERLRLDAYRVAPYHAGLPAARRGDIQDAFFSGALDAVVATSAFGMGIDKPDVRTVVHAGMPGSLDESKMGDASVHAVVDAIEAASGRITLRELAEASKVSRQGVERVVDELLELQVLRADGNNAVTVPPRMPPDVFTRVAAAGSRRQAILTSRIEAARQYAETTRCRRSELLGYFGEHYEPPCAACDNDTSPAPARRTAETSLPAGVPVRHRLWGRGVLLSRDEHELVVAFDSVGYRHLTAAALTNGLLTMV